MLIAKKGRRIDGWQSRRIGFQIEKGHYFSDLAEEPFESEEDEADDAESDEPDELDEVAELDDPEELDEVDESDGLDELEELDSSEDFPSEDLDSCWPNLLAPDGERLSVA